MKNTQKLALALAGIFATSTAPAQTTVFIGDAASQGVGVTDQQIPDNSNAGAFTYAFPNSGYTNSTGGPVSVTIDSINFWSEYGTGNVTPFFALYSGSNIGLATNYSVISTGSPISGATVGLHQADYTPSLGSGTFNLDAGQTLIAGFFQDSSVVPYFNALGDADYLFNNTAGSAASAGTGYTLPASVPNPLTANASYGTLTRTYAYNAELTVTPVPEPSAPALALLTGLTFLRRRK